MTEKTNQYHIKTCAKKSTKSLCFLFQSVLSSQEGCTPFSDSTTRSPSTPSHPFVGLSTSPSSHPASPWMGISSLSSRWDLTSRGPSSASSSTTSGTSSPTCTTATEVSSLPVLIDRKVVTDVGILKWFLVQILAWCHVLICCSLKLDREDEKVTSTLINLTWHWLLPFVLYLTIGWLYVKPVSNSTHHIQCR